MSSPQNNKKEAMVLLAEGVSVLDVAKKVGVRRETVWRWSQQPEFKAQLTVYREQALRDAQAVLGEVVKEALGALRRVMADPTAKDADVVKAAKIVLDKAELQVNRATLSVDSDAQEVAGWLEGDA